MFRTFTRLPLYAWCEIGQWNKYLWLEDWHGAVVAREGNATRAHHESNAFIADIIRTIQRHPGDHWADA